ncbi:LexA family transcriptional regulator [Flavobacterium sp. IMCC34518]|uniref:S24 family peptidase n=1 Tax=Flavobacterium sp. IMCC34518 TaxID=3003623 RepID=UPI002482AA65|nr:LexA family transcriptional regulator [Flavobacterium sp. IMCC34518]
MYFVFCFTNIENIFSIKQITDNIFAMIKKRIIQLLEYKGIAKEEFYKKIGVTSANFRGKASETPVNSKTIENILSEISDLNLDWLLTGTGSMLKEKLNAFSEPSINHTREEKKLIPLYDGVATAGTLETAMLDPTHESVEMIDAGDWFRDATAAMRVHGDSMYPEYKSGSIAALREVQNKRLVVYGQDYLIETTEYRVIKRLQKSDLPQNWLACSVNEEKYESSGRLIHEPFDVHIDDVKRLYQVLGNVKRNQSSTVIHAGKPIKRT